MGLAGSGKDTCAEYLIKQYGFIRYAFGDKVKDLARCLFGFSEEQLYGNEKEIVDKRWNITPRESFQVLGTEFGQYFLHKEFPRLNVSDREFWSKQFEYWYNNEYKKNRNLRIVITDVRFLHEVKTIKNLNGYIIQIIRPSLIKTKIHNHCSETEQNSIPQTLISKTIYNDKTKEDLFNELKYTLN